VNIIKNERDKLMSPWTIIGWCVYIDYRKMNEVTQKDHFPVPLLIKC